MLAGNKLLLAGNKHLVLLIRLLRGIEIVDLLYGVLPLFLGAHHLIENLVKLVFELISLWLGHTDPIVDILKV